MFGLTVWRHLEPELDDALHSVELRVGDQPMQLDGLANQTLWRSSLAILARRAILLVHLRGSNLMFRSSFGFLVPPFLEYCRNIH